MFYLKKKWKYIFLKSDIVHKKNRTFGDLPSFTYIQAVQRHTLSNKTSSQPPVTYS